MKIDNALFTSFTEVKKNDDGTLNVYGLMTDETLDGDGQIADLNWAREQLPKWSKWANVREMHQAKAVGVGVSTEDAGTGIYLESKIVDKDAIAKVEAGVYKGYSIGIKGMPGNPYKVTKDVGAPKGRICGGEIIEVSLVDRPANPNATFSVVKSIDYDDIDTRSTADIQKLAQAAELIRSVVSPSASKGTLTGDPPVQSEDNELPQFVLDLGKRDFTAEQRHEAASSGAAMSDGSFPIEDKEDLKNAIRLAGHTKDPSAARRHIRQRARALGATDMLPESWKSLVDVEKSPISVSANINMSSGVYGEMTYEEAIRELLEALGLRKEAEEAETGEDVREAEKTVTACSECGQEKGSNSDCKVCKEEKAQMDKVEIAEAIKSMTAEERKELGLFTQSEELEALNSRIEELTTQVADFGKKVVPTAVKVDGANPTLPLSGELESLKREKAIYEPLAEEASDSSTRQFAAMKLTEINKAIAAHNTPEA